jgi:hypothetical protein
MDHSFLDLGTLELQEFEKQISEFVVWGIATRANYSPTSH